MHPKILLLGMTIWLTPTIARADGGTVRFSEVRGDRRITVFTSPTTLRAGLIDVSILVQDAKTGATLFDRPILVSAHPIDEPWRRTNVLATTEAATNKLLSSAAIQLALPGWWHLEIALQDSDRDEIIGFDIELANAPPPWLDLSMWIAWPLLVVLAFALHQCLAARRPAKNLG